MLKTIVKLSHRHIIDASSKTVFEKSAWHYSYQEFLLKSQAYNSEGKFKTFTEIKANDGRANSLHYKSGFAITGFIETLNKKNPFFEDNSGKTIGFDTCNLELIESDISNQLQHIIALHFTTAPLILHRSFGNFLVLSQVNNVESPHETFMLQLQPNISIVHYEEKE